MLSFPNCKINLGLHILNKREDGFHNLETVFYPVGLKDAVEIIPAHNTTSPITFTSSGLIVDGNNGDNICIKAYHLLKKDFPELPAIKMHLHKAIPMGAGLGGGSADGAFVLMLLNKKFNLNLSTPELLNYASQLGSDCPFFIINKPCYATGRGEILEAINTDLSKYTIILINPGIHINTGWAFSQLTPALPQKTIKEIITQPITSWQQELKNDFEMPVFEKYPAIKNIKEALYTQGAVYASMSGSGSTVYGIFEKAMAAPQFTGTGYFVKTIV
ncbi:4-(cytidine 5'-diphospho)-2-C-methyl-D-erythritol kinase [Ferruginibacter sp. SUN106]|uniref:4-(cytidine 5'-diphospho)-2-C-methyl-D-erythritol kinase n=1 Tax=Ferruginibacter sp. SUN106 TaxID=2978348 RepID=UPI003D36EBD5